MHNRQDTMQDEKIVDKTSANKKRTFSAISSEDDRAAKKARTTLDKDNTNDTEAGTSLGDIETRAQQINPLEQQSLEPRLFWRADSREPEDVFASGFGPRNPINPDQWWKSCINDNSKYNANSDANPLNCVSISHNLASCCIFPCDNVNLFISNRHQFSQDCYPSRHTTYLYAIATPSTCLINQEKELKNEQVLTQDLKDLVVDLHPFQAEETQKILSNNPAAFFDNKNNILIAGGCLYGYEAMAYRIESKNIICAIKVSRSNESRININGSHFRTQEYMRKFKLDDQGVYNSHFQATQSIFMVDHDKKPFVKTVDYQPIKSLAIQSLRDMKHVEHTTPSMIDGFDGKVFKLSDGNVLNFTSAAFSLFRQPPLTVTKDSEEFSNDQCVMQ